MSTQRDELARELFIADNSNQSREQSIVDWQWFNDTIRFRGRIEHYKTMADALLAAGWTKPREIITVEELDALADGSVVIDADAYVGIKTGAANGRDWQVTLHKFSKDRIAFCFPVTVLREGADQ